jgi:phosphate transport system ATP-binding protein
MNRLETAVTSLKSGSARPSGQELYADKMRTIDLSAWFGLHQALRAVTLPVPDRQVTTIIGPSGCGKSTLLRCLNRMHEIVPEARISGSVLLDGRDIYQLGTDPAGIRRRVGMVFQKPNPFPTMSIRDNVLAGLRLNGILPEDPETLVAHALSQAALWDEVKDVLGRSGVSLSGGQQQRLCIARCLALKPEVVLMDEPCSSLDPIATARIEELIHELRTEYAILVVTHNLQQAARIGDLTAFFCQGELIEYGRTDRTLRLRGSSRYSCCSGTRTASTKPSCRGSANSFS